MPSFSRSKTHVAFLVFLGLVLAGAGFLAMQDPNDQITETFVDNENREDPDGRPAVIVTKDGSTDPTSDGTGAGTDVGRAGSREGRTEAEKAALPPLFPTKDIRTRQGFYLAFSALCRKTPEDFRKRAQMAFDGDYPLAAKEAALSAWHDWYTEDRSSPFDKLFAIRPKKGELADGSTVRLQAFAVKHLTAKAATDADSRAILTAYLETRPPRAGLRKQSYAAVLRWGQAEEVRRCLPALIAESDAACIQASADALRQSTESEARIILRDLAKRHPSAAAREQFQQALTQD